LYKSFRIKNFRCFKDFSIDNLDRVNLIVGGNNVGKTALLEAIYLHSGGEDVELTLGLNAIRGYETGKVPQDTWLPLFHRYDGTTAIEIESSDDGQQVRQQQWTHHLSAAATQKEPMLTLKQGNQAYAIRIWNGEIEISSQGQPAVPCRFVKSWLSHGETSEIANYSDLEVENPEHDVHKLLQVVDSRFKRLTIVLVDGKPTLHGDIGIGRLIPLAFMGEGVRRLTSLAINAASLSKGVLLIDEIENGVYYAAMTDIWRGIAELARRFDVQIFATTHSFECITAAHEAFKKSGTYDFRLHRLERVENEIKAFTFDEEMLDAVLTAGWEVR